MIKYYIMKGSSQMKDSVVFYKSFYEAIEELPTKYQAAVYAAICKYSFYGEIPELSGVAKALFIVMKANIDASEKRYAAAVENGKKGGRPKKDSEKPEETEENPIETERKPIQNLTETETEPNQNLNDNENVTDTVTENVTVDVTVTSDAAVNTVAFLETQKHDLPEEKKEEAEEETKPQEEKTVEALPLLNGKEYPVFASDVEKWKQSYPNVDIEAELRRMKDWLNANPKKKKAPMDIQRFITGWLGNELKEQKNRPAYSAVKKPAAQQNPPGFDPDEFWKSAITRSQEIMAELDRENQARNQWK